MLPYIPYMDPMGIVNSWIFDTPTPDVERFNMVQPYISVVWALQLCLLVDKSHKLWTHLP